MEPVLAALQETQIMTMVGFLILLFLWEPAHLGTRGRCHPAAGFMDLRLAPDEP